MITPLKIKAACAFLTTLVFFHSPVESGCELKSSGRTGSSEDTEIVFAETTSYEQNLLNYENFTWITARAPHFIIYYEKDSFAEKHLEFLRERAEEAVSRALKILGESDYRKGIRLIMVDSRNRMEDLIGRRYAGFAPIGHSVILLVFNAETRPYLRHEIMHKVSINLWGEPETWLREGSAMYADMNCLSYENPLVTIPAYLLKQGMLHPMTELLTNFDELTRENDLITYLQSGSFFQFLYEKYDLASIKALWQRGSSEFTEIFGESIEELEEKWLERLGSADTDDTPVDWEELMERGCG